MPKGKNGKKKQTQSLDFPITALAYHGPVVAVPRTPRADDYVTVLGAQGTCAWGSSAGRWLGRILFRASSSGGVPATVTGNWYFSVGDVPSFTSFSTEFGSFRVLGLKVSVVNFLDSSTNGFGSQPMLSTVVRENPTALSALIDTPGVEIHPISTMSNMFTREMRMEGVDEAEWVDCTNVYTAISPQAVCVLEFPDTPNTLKAAIYMQYRVQFRGRL